MITIIIIDSFKVLIRMKDEQIRSVCIENSIQVVFQLTLSYYLMIFTAMFRDIDYYFYQTTGLLFHLHFEELSSLNKSCRKYS